MIKKNLQFIFLLPLIFIQFIAKSQLYEVSLDEKIANCTLIAEGKVISKTSFWNDAHSMILTANKVEVYKIFKGNAAPATIEVLTQGGSIGGDDMEASDLLTVEVGHVGTFFCFFNSLLVRSPQTGMVLYDVYGSSQGFLRYDLSANKAFAPFIEYHDIQGNFYNILKTKTGNAIRVVNAGFQLIKSKKKEIAARPEATAVISSYSPATVNAGALNDPATNVLTIAGSGFGTPVTGRQIVFKDNSNTNTTADYSLESTSPYIISWTNTSIVARVPSRAGTGRFGIVNSAGDTGFAATPLNVFYSILNGTFYSGTVVSEPRLMNASTLGGYSIDYSTNTAGSGTNILTDSAYDCFRRALITWKDLTGVNFLEAGTTANQVVNANDGLNSIMFDNANTSLSPLPAGVLATTYSGYTICGTTLTAQKTGFDMVIRKDGFSTGTTTISNKTYCGLRINTLDLEATIFHELGHALNLGHIYDPLEQTSGYTTRNPNKVMHPTATLSIGRKSPDQSAFAGALYNITPQNNSYGTCRSISEMTPLATNVSPYNECPSSFPLTTIAPGTLVNIDLEHCSSNKTKDPQFTAISTANATFGPGVPVTNNAYYAIKTENAGDLVFNILNYQTAPADAMNNCTEQGGRIAVYQVNACPAGQAFPAPVYTTTFTANTVKTISGLAGNTTYLMYFDGLYGTKASFNVVFSGSALPVELADFYGEAKRSVNDLFAEMKTVAGKVKMIVQRSSDCTAFQEIGAVQMRASAVAVKYNYQDASPLNGNNYYRLKIIDQDGSFTYSKVILLQNKLAGNILMYPNPVRGKLTIDLSYIPQDSYTIAITDVSGRKIFTQKNGSGVLKVPLEKQAAGMYFVQIMNSKNELVSVSKLHLE